jgi:6-phosphogluconolactonase
MVVRLKSAEAVAANAAAAVVEAAFKAIHEHGEFRLVLSGGRTPRMAYQLLAGDLRDEVDWRRVIFYFGDERCIPPDHPASNYKMAKEALFDPLKVQGNSVRRMAGELPPPSAAADYDAEVRAVMAERKPAFDLVLLGMGAEGHTASLFPESPALDETTRSVVNVVVPIEPPERLSMTPVAFGSARQILFLVTGEEKAEALARVFGGGDDLPAARVSQLAPSQFLVDEAAASKLPA